jgi:hypothetical protein
MSATPFWSFEKDTKSPAARTSGRVLAGAVVVPDLAHHIVRGESSDTAQPSAIR